MKYLGYIFVARGRFLLKDFDGYFAIDVLVMCEVDLAKSTLTQNADQAVLAID
jgi:hypothetical protein